MHATKVRSGDGPMFVHVVGDGHMTLAGRYDPNQLWFPFMERAVFVSYEQNEPKPYKKANLPNYKFVQIHAHFRRLYPLDADPCQMVLPFREGKRVSNKQAKVMERHDFKTWDHDSDGNLYTVVIRSDEKRKDIEEWLHDNCQRRFILKCYPTIIFESAVDAINGKLRFS